ncbi:MAG: PfkB family carbohydrate kinase [Bacilli bacterium]
MKAVCIGHASYDITIPVDSYPKENTKNRINIPPLECGGGPSATAAYLLGKWGMETYFVGAVGNDYYGHKIINEFNSLAMSLKYIEVVDDARTSTSYILANTEKGSRTIMSSRDPNLLYHGSSISLKPDVIMIDGEELAISKQVLLANKDAISVMDAGKYRRSTFILGPLVTYFICSKDFAEDFLKVKIDSSNQRQLCSVYHRLYEVFKTNIVVTLEEEGCLAKIDDKLKLIPSIKVKAIDSTGAGDIFHGAFTYFIANHIPYEASLRFANITAAISVTRMGSRFSIPSLKEVVDYVKKYVI